MARFLMICVLLASLVVIALGKAVHYNCLVHGDVLFPSECIYPTDDITTKMCLVENGQLCVFRSLYCETSSVYYHGMSYWDYYSFFSGSSSNYWYYSYMNVWDSDLERCDLRSQNDSFSRISSVWNSDQPFHYTYNQSSACFGDKIPNSQVIGNLTVQNGSLTLYDSYGVTLWSIAPPVNYRYTTYITVGYNSSVHSSQFWLLWHAGDLINNQSMLNTCKVLQKPMEKNYTNSVYYYYLDLQNAGNEISEDSRINYYPVVFNVSAGLERSINIGVEMCQPGYYKKRLQKSFITVTFDSVNLEGICKYMVYHLAIKNCDAASIAISFGAVASVMVKLTKARSPAINSLTNEGNI